MDRRSLGSKDSNSRNDINYYFKSKNLCKDKNQNNVVTTKDPKNLNTIDTPTWNCIYCTFINNKLLTSCEMCGTETHAPAPSEIINCKQTRTSDDRDLTFQTKIAKNSENEDLAIAKKLNLAEQLEIENKLSNKRLLIFSIFTK
jgi:hypothetical protein